MLLTTVTDGVAVAILDNIGDLMTEGNTRSHELSFIAQPKNNGAKYKCAASSVATNTPVKRSINISVYCECKPDLSMICGVFSL